MEGKVKILSKRFLDYLTCLQGSERMELKIKEMGGRWNKEFVQELRFEKFQLKRTQKMF